MIFKLKDPKTYYEQLELLKSRGMTINNEDEALLALKSFNYYRLSGYMLRMKQSKGSENFKVGTNFDHVLLLYNFDMELRHILLCAIDDIEIKVRTTIAYEFSHAAGAYGHYNEIFFNSYDSRDAFCDSLDKAIQKNQDTLFVKHHIQKYSIIENGKSVYNLPLWVAVEILSLSTISKFYKNIGIYTIKKDIANTFDTAPELLESWLHSIANLRNICAHHGRIYDRKLLPSVKYSYKAKKHYQSLGADLDTDMLFGFIPALLKLLPDKRSKNLLLSALSNLMNSYGHSVDLSAIGFPSNWECYFNEWYKSPAI